MSCGWETLLELVSPFRRPINQHFWWRLGVACCLDLAQDCLGSIGMPVEMAIDTDLVAIRAMKQLLTLTSVPGFLSIYCNTVTYYVMWQSCRMQKKQFCCFEKQETVVEYAHIRCHTINPSMLAWTSISNACLACRILWFQEIMNH